jgi:hypothetical protein
MDDGPVESNLPLFIRESQRGDSVGLFGALDPSLIRTMEQHTGGVRMGFEDSDRPVAERTELVNTEPIKSEQIPFQYRRRGHGTEWLFEQPRYGARHAKEVQSGRHRDRKQVQHWEQEGGFEQRPVKGFWE